MASSPPSKEFQAIRQECIDLARSLLKASDLLSSRMNHGFIHLPDPSFPVPVYDLGRATKEEDLPPLDESRLESLFKPYAHYPVDRIPVWHLKQEEALDSANELLYLIADVKRMAETDAVAILTDACTKYSVVYESFKPLWALVKAWGVDVSGLDDWEGDIDEVITKAKARGGRPPRFKSREEVLDWLRPGIEAYAKGTFPVTPSIELVAGRMGYHSNTIRLHIHPYWPDWESVLTDFFKMSRGFM
jgi:hypothetical protein